jgi:hypothetical protein
MLPVNAPLDAPVAAINTRRNTKLPFADANRPVPPEIVAISIVLIAKPSSVGIPCAAGALLGCNPILDPLWSDARFRGAMRALAVEVCALAKRLPVSRAPR